MKELKYETKDDLICITPCPYGSKAGIPIPYRGGMKALK